MLLQLSIQCDLSNPLKFYGTGFLNCILPVFSGQNRRKSMLALLQLDLRPWEPCSDPSRGDWSAPLQPLPYHTFSTSKEESYECQRPKWAVLPASNQGVSLLSKIQTDPGSPFNGTTFLICLSLLKAPISSVPHIFPAQSDTISQIEKYWIPCGFAANFKE